MSYAAVGAVALAEAAAYAGNALEQAIEKHDELALQVLLKQTAISGAQKSVLSKHAEEALEKTKSNLVRPLDKSDSKRLFGGSMSAFFGAGVLAVTLAEIRRRFKDDESFTDVELEFIIRILGGCHFTIFGALQIYKGFMKHDRVQKYYKALAIKDILETQLKNK